VCVMVGCPSVRCPSVCLSRRLTAACSWFAASWLSIDSCRRQSTGCGQRQWCDLRRRVDADLFLYNITSLRCSWKMVPSRRQVSTAGDDDVGWSSLRPVNTEHSSASHIRIQRTSDYAFVIVVIKESYYYYY